MVVEVPMNITWLMLNTLFLWLVDHVPVNNKLYHLFPLLNDEVIFSLWNICGYVLRYRYITKHLILSLRQIQQSCIFVFTAILEEIQWLRKSYILYI